MQVCSFILPVLPFGFNECIMHWGENIYRQNKKPNVCHVCFIRKDSLVKMWEDDLN